MLSINSNQSPTDCSRNSSNSSRNTSNRSNSSSHRDGSSSTSATTAVITRHAQDVTLLPSDFRPGDCHVVCARGKAFWSHPGNVTYRRLIASAAPKYATAKSKMDKSIIVGELIAAVEVIGPGACLVKRTSKGWVAASETFAREKISQSLRDALQGQYRSSTAFKRRRHAAVDADVDRVVQNDTFISERIMQLTKDLAVTHTDTSDLVIDALFCQANIDILDRIKTDEKLFRMVRESSHEAAKGCGNSVSV